jgi:hypothetical protein
MASSRGGFVVVVVIIIIKSEWRMAAARTSFAWGPFGLGSRNGAQGRRRVPDQKGSPESSSKHPLRGVHVCGGGVVGKRRFQTNVLKKGMRKWVVGIKRDGKFSTRTHFVLKKKQIMKTERSFVCFSS